MKSIEFVTPSPTAEPEWNWWTAVIADIDPRDQANATTA
jgi:hypothetical protein